MVPPTGTERALGAPLNSFGPRTPVDTRPGSAPIATTIVLFAVVAVLLGFIAWN
jgi:hypothetical protein